MMKKIIFMSLFAAFFAVNHSNDIECKLCLDIVSAVEEFLKDGATQDDIIEYLEQFCETFDSKLIQNTCKGLVEEKLPGIIDALVNGFPPQSICEMIGSCNGTISTTTPFPDGRWFYIMTELEGGRVIRLMPDHHSIEMYGKGEYDSSGQLWRLESNGCLRNKDVDGKCLAIEGSKQGALVYMHDETGTDEQVWRYTDDKYIQSAVVNDEIINKGYLVLDVIWADVSLITDGAGVHTWHKDNTVSEKWNFILVE